MHYNPVQQEFLQRFLIAAKRNRAAEKTPDRRLTPEERELEARDWKAFSRSRGYTEAEIADFEAFIGMVDEAQQIGLTVDDLAVAEFEAEQAA